jgi:hypothetical protein
MFDKLREVYQPRDPSLFVKVDNALRPLLLAPPDVFAPTFGHVRQ